MKKRYLVTFVMVISLVVSSSIVSAFSYDNSLESANQQEEKGRIILKYSAPEMDWESTTKGGEKTFEGNWMET